MCSYITCGGQRRTYNDTLFHCSPPYSLETRPLTELEACYFDFAGWPANSRELCVTTPSEALNPGPCACRAGCHTPKLFPSFPNYFSELGMREGFIQEGIVENFSWG